LVDLDGDGRLDVLSGSWPGELFLFRGGPDRTFAAPIKLKNKDGKSINIGGGVREQGEMILVAGDAKFDRDDKGATVIVYEGRRIEVPAGKEAGITGTASAVFACDWDGDGDLDLLVGDIGGNVHLVPNEGTARAYAFGAEQALLAGGKALRVDGGDAGPCAADWDGDGDLDLLVGAGNGSVWLYRNVGTAKAPELAAGERLAAPGEATHGPGAPREPRRGIRAKVCVADWNGDGRPDLLVGDFATQKPDLPELTPQQQAEHDKLRKELEAAQEEAVKLTVRYRGVAREKDAAQREKLSKELDEVYRRMGELREKLPREYENHGWVWLFLREPARAAPGR
jgi:hypothetical protein